jgi:hypothetical protein
MILAKKAMSMILRGIYESGWKATREKQFQGRRVCPKVYQLTDVF